MRDVLHHARLMSSTDTPWFAAQPHGMGRDFTRITGSKASALILLLLLLFLLFAAGFGGTFFLSAVLSRFGL